MNDERPGPQYPVYPPRTPQPVHRTSPWVWVAIAMSGLAILAAAVVAVAFFFYVSDPIEDGGEYFVTQSSVEDAVDEPCDGMVAAAAKIHVFGPREESIQSLRGFTTAAQAIVNAIDGAGPDGDSRAWMRDWTTLIDAVDAFASRLAEGPARFEMPDAGDGYVVSERMYWGSPEGCEVPLVIEALDPESAAEYYEFE